MRRREADTVKLKEWIDQSKRIVFFGGAGVSTRSGIPDFRSETGIYRAMTQYGFAPEEILSHHFFAAHPDVFYQFYREQMLYLDALPNPAHLAIAELERRGKLKAVVTQNIDGLHQRAGSRQVFELHGSVLRNYCMQCGAFYGVEYVVGADGIPYCDRCGGMVKPDVVLYEEPLDESVISQSVKAIAKADMLIVGGTSLNVYPAAGFVRYFHGERLALINQSTTPFDSQAGILIHDDIADVLAEAVGI